MTIHGFTDGAARGNPGPGGIGIVLRSESGETLLKEKKYLGKVTNNVAEYSALIECLLQFTELRARNKISCTRLVMHSDSELMVRQLNGQYKVKDRELKKLYDKVRELIHGLQIEFSIMHVPRELNREADALANDSIDEQP
ncbi:MAG TPA: ribonuclease HI family protein [Bacteroidota bacterium]|nr:ribonuclease HI family protein [Bacteroidota bacterium]